MILPFLFTITSAAATVSQVDDYIYRGRRPPSIAWLKDNGFKQVINLESGLYDGFHDDDYEHGSDPDVLKINYPWSDFTAPSDAQLKTVTWFLNRNEQEHTKTYIHCLHGKDRTGMAVAAYKIIYKGMSPDDAIKDMYAHGFHKVPYAFWVKNLRKLK